MTLRRIARFNSSQSQGKTEENVIAQFFAEEAWGSAVYRRNGVERKMTLDR